MKKESGVTCLKSKSSIILSFLILFISCMPVYAEDAGGAAKAEITGLEIADFAVRIKVAGPIKYKIYKPEDPFRLIVDLEGVSIGKFKDKIFSDKAGITDISPVQVQTPAPAARLNILLQAPSTVIPEINGDTLVLNIKEAAKAKDEQVPASSDAQAAEAGDGAAEEITKITFNKTDDGGELIIKGDGTIPSPAVFELDNKVVIDIPGVVMKASPASGFSSPLKDIKYRVEEGRVRLILDLDGGFDTEVFALDDELFVDMSGKVLSKGKERPAGSVSQPVPAKKEDEPKGGSKLISLDFQDADIIPILRLLSDVSGYNIVIHPDVKGKITMKLINVPWEQALDIILKTFNLEKVIDGNVIRVATLKVFQDERKAVAETKEVFGKAEDIVTKVFVVNYANVDKIKDSIDKAKLLSPRGNISTDPRTRSMIVKDVPSSLGEIQKLIDTLDKPTTQVLIEARIVEVSTNYSRELGVEWGGRWLNGPLDSMKTPITGSVSSSPVLGGNTLNPSLVSLGATGTPTGAITVGYLNAAQTFGLDLRISALEANGKGKVVSNPKIMTVDNEKAVIKQGRRIPYSTVSNSGTQVQFVDASLDLIVTPQVGPDKTILLIIQANKNEADFSQTSQGLPSIRTSEATTQVLVRDGETVVIGGILKTSETDNENNVPGISKIPVLGWLFKRKAAVTSSEEQLIFITPRIVK
ncbi:MAG: type IV pilus secretin PilQ [Nitrospirae bacterium]|nr:type IV pilus secretin PilQ [Nitrospirota bacterium]MCL5237943.1 type IV pilus secretin PilQ [Nitrospirota bacterium]